MTGIFPVIIVFNIQINCFNLKALATKDLKF